MLKIISIALVLLLTLTACGDKDDKKPSDTQASPSTTSYNTISNGNGEEVELNAEDLLAMDLINDEIFLDECTAYSLEDKVNDSDLKAYLDDCVAQLKLEASIIIEPQDGTEKQESTTNSSSSDSTQ